VQILIALAAAEITQTGIERLDLGFKEAKLAHHAIQ
jgi:hypothetical protein